jgi:TRAP-type uncharacterized transport system substrate-binding protein
MQGINRESRDAARDCARSEARTTLPWRAALMAGALASAVSGLPAASAAQDAPGATVVGAVADRRDMPLTEDLAAVLAPQHIRVLPIAGRGPVQNAHDLLHLKGVDFAILPSDLFAYLGKKKLLPEAATRVRLVTQIYHRQFHLLARITVPDMAGLAGRKVSFGPPGSGDDITATLVFDAAGVRPTPVYLEEEEALKELLSGRIDAIAVTAKAPAPLLQALNRGQGVHFLPVPDAAALRQLFRPAQLTIEEYPLLIGAGEAGRGPPVPTVEVGEVLAAYDFSPETPRGKNAARFVNALLRNLTALRAASRDPRWREADPSATPAGWTRYAPAVAWLQGAPMLSGSSTAPAPAASGKASQDKRLFQEFWQWRQRQHPGGGFSGEAPR